MSKKSGMLDLIQEASDTRYKKFNCQILVNTLVGGTPDDPKVVKAWIEKNLGVDNQELIQSMVATTMVELGLEQDEAVEQTVKTMKLNRFKRDATNGLYMEGRHVKACIKEAANIAWPKRQDWGPSRKGTRSYWAEHVFVPEDRIYLGVQEPSGILQSFVHSFKVHAPKYEEFCTDVKLSFTVKCDAGDNIKPEEFATMFSIAQNMGLGSGRSQGYGTFQVVSWDEIS